MSELMDELKLRKPQIIHLLHNNTIWLGLLAQIHKIKVTSMNYTHDNRNLKVNEILSNT